MNWLFFAILSTILYTLVNFVDKYVLAAAVQNYRVMPIYSSAINLTVGMILWVVSGFPMMNRLDTAITILAGSIFMASSVLYFRVMEREHTSVVIILLQMQPVMILILSLLFLQESLSAWQLVGFVLILTATMAVSGDSGDTRLRISPSLLPVFLMNLGFSVATILIKVVADRNDLLPVVITQSWGIGLGGGVLFLVMAEWRYAFMCSLGNIPRKALSVILLNEGVFVYAASAAGVVALSLGPAALVKVVSSTTVFFGILIGWLLTVLAGSVFQEDITRRSLIRKTSWAAVVFVGLLLVG
jgi:uncharacterized membrane protein